MYRALWGIQRIQSFASAPAYSRLLRSNRLQSANGESKSLKEDFKDEDGRLSYDDRSQTEIDSPKSTKLNTFEKRREVFQILDRELQADYRIKQMQQYYNDELVQSLEHCQSMAGLLRIVEPHTSQLRTDHLEVIYAKINMLCEEAIQKMSTSEYDQLKESVRSSPAFVSLLARTMDLIRELDNSCLVKQFLALCLLDQNLASLIMAATCQMLKKKVNDLELEQIKDCIKVLSSYSIDSSLGNFFSAFYPALLLVASSKIMSNKYDYEDVDLVIGFFVEFTRSSNFQPCYNAAMRLVEVLLLEENQLNFQQAIRLMRRIPRIPFLNSLPNADLALFRHLINKCNSVIYQTLALSATEENINAYLDVYRLLNVSHHYSDKKHLNLCDYRILSILSQILSSTEQDDRTLFNIIFGHCINGIYDERLLAQFYERICSDRYPNGEPFDPYQLYSLFTNLRLPFVDQERLAKLLFNPKDRTALSSYGKYKNLKTMLKLVLTDVRDEELLNHFLTALEVRRNGFRHARDKPTYFLWLDMSLARANLSLFGQTEIETKIENLLRELMHFPAFNYQNSPKRFFTASESVNQKIANDVSLSNGVAIHSFAVYDSYRDDLLPLFQFREQFDQIDKIALDPHQQLLAFVVKLDIKGTASVYESNAEYQLKKLLKHLNIAIIEINSEEAAFPSTQLVDLALESVHSLSKRNS